MNNPVVSLYYKSRDKVRIIGTGVFISPSHILTCYHVAIVTKKLTALVKFADKEVHIQTSRLIMNPRLDFALLSVNDSFSFIPMSTERDILDKTVTIVCPHERKSPFKGKITYTRCVSEDYLEEVSYLIEGPILKPGTSGSPVIYDNKLLGIHYGGGFKKINKNKSQCVPIQYIQEEILKKSKPQEPDSQ